MSTRVVVMSVASICAAGVSLADPPAGYYDGVVGADGVPTRSALSGLLNNAVTRSYGDARTLLQDTDEDPANPANIILAYNAASIVSTWTSGATWNREHCWPRSLGVGSSGSDNSDLHMLRPCNPGVNSSRGNLPFGSGPGAWDPDRFGHRYRGEMARVSYYANTRYTYLNMSAIGSQAELVDWHYDQMPDEDDLRRNDRVFDHQQNRNPFVDHPEWVWALYGDAPSDGQIVLAGVSSSGGASSMTIDLGAYISDGSAFTTGIDLAKSGSAPTSYLVSVTGDLTSGAADGLQDGFARGSQSRSIPVMLDGGVGLLEGELRIENTEVTTAGAGLGRADGDDVVSVVALALEPSLASLDPALPLAEDTIDLGDIPVGQITGPIEIEVHNLADQATGADLDIDGVIISGLFDSVGVGGAPALGVAAGASAVLELTVQPTTPGTISAVATIMVSDEDIPGATSRALTLTVLANAVGECLADVNMDGAVTPTDFGAWLAAFNAGDPAADQNEDGEITPTDFGAWLANFNAGCG